MVVAWCFLLRVMSGVIAVWQRFVTRYMPYNIQCNIIMIACYCLLLLAIACYCLLLRAIACHCLPLRAIACY